MALLRTSYPPARFSVVGATAYRSIALIAHILIVCNYIKL